MGAAFGIGAFLAVDMAIVHQWLRLHGVLVSDLFEYLVLILAAVIMYRNAPRPMARAGRDYWNGAVLGASATLFADVVLVDEVLRLHAVNYPEQLHLAMGAVAGIAALSSAVYQALRPAA